jgi:hypothetical protein
MVTLLEAQIVGVGQIVTTSCYVHLNMEAFYFHQLYV